MTLERNVHGTAWLRACTRDEHLSVRNLLEARDPKGRLLELVGVDLLEIANAIVYLMDVGEMTFDEVRSLSDEELVRRGLDRSLVPRVREHLAHG